MIILFFRALLLASSHEIGPNRPNQENGLTLKGVQIMHDLSHDESPLSNYIVPRLLPEPQKS